MAILLKKMTIFANGNFVEKMTIFVNFFEKMSSFWQFFDSQMAIFQRVRCGGSPEDFSRRHVARIHP